MDGLPSTLHCPGSSRVLREEASGSKLCWAACVGLSHSQALPLALFCGLADPFPCSRPTEHLVQGAAPPSLLPVTPVTPGVSGHRGACDLSRVVDAAPEEIIFAKNRPQFTAGTQGFSATKMTRIETKQQNATQEVWREGNDMKRPDMLCPRGQPSTSWASVTVLGSPADRCANQAPTNAHGQAHLHPGSAGQADRQTFGHTDSVA